MIGNGEAIPQKRKGGRPRKNPVAVAAPIGPKPKLPALDPYAAQAEADAHAAEGNRKLCMAVDALRGGLETIVQAEWDHQSGMSVDAPTLRKLAVAALDAYSQITGQNWRRAKLTGPTRAGDRNQGSLKEQGYDDHE